MLCQFIKYVIKTRMCDQTGQSNRLKVGVYHNSQTIHCKITAQERYSSREFTCCSCYYYLSFSSFSCCSFHYAYSYVGRSDASHPNRYCGDLCSGPNNRPHHNHNRCACHWRCSSGKTFAKGHGYCHHCSRMKMSGDGGGASSCSYCSKTFWVHVPV